ncbi:MAG: rhodanese-like domain-containing protein [Prevotella sp.]|uniref:rhodanese-like domain-containing protein n=1 Tax=Prevotella sp. AGR2160 TaxID=1280674 RepID=UPI000490F76E|nr:rhodanese-like domain-containing protein [Prevotella sp. AGR2160]MDD5861763.1 rhodanese-like domain-containing protein [Prevotella sp.]
MKKLFAFLLGFLGLTVCANAQTDSIRTVDAPHFAEMIRSDTAFLVDVRTAEEYGDGHIDHAVNIDVLKPDFKDKSKSLPKGKFIAVYCRSGKRSLRAAHILAKEGYRVINLRGGWMEWEEYAQKQNIR